jgi:hypothetical protein
MAAKTSPLPINMTRVLALPTACGESPTVFSKCKGELPALSSPLLAPDLAQIFTDVKKKIPHKSHPKSYSFSRK